MVYTYNGDYSVFRKNTCFKNGKVLKTLCQVKKKASHKKANTLLFQLFRVSKVARVTETKVLQWSAGARVSRDGRTVV